MSSLLRAYPAPLALSAIIGLASSWYSTVLRLVPEMYLDEYFHISQAQKYCNGDYTWDPKITTPPGLYLVSRFLKPLLGCDTSSLRILNTISLCALVLLSYGVLRRLRARGRQSDRLFKAESIEEDPTRLLDAHSALNIALFPPLFFFSALYYTDVLSTLLVVCTFYYTLRAGSVAQSMSDKFMVAILGFMSLWFRQTNIFWVAIFPAGLSVVNSLKRDGGSKSSRAPENTRIGLQKSWSEGLVYDCAFQEAGPQDYILFALSLVMAILRRPVLVLRTALPYIALLVLFAGFVFWNGSVVLGDKSAHTAMIHIPQFLYVWPYIAFFSWPLLVGPLLRPFVPFLPPRLQSICNEAFYARKVSLRPTLLVSVVFLIGASVAVHFNTFIHPYSMGDNRHYLFYIFRLIRLRPALKYLAVPVYYICAWLVLQALASPASDKEGGNPQLNSRPINDEAAPTQPQISFITIWLATGALSVVTAPLVEPRYFIIHWITWRLHVPCTPASLLQHPSNGKTVYDKRLVLETMWLLAINAAVSYTFLYRTFSWPSEPGNKQRFIW
ncbi:hypothetical protein NX059_008851 [Plenodomus lindquistii]|nr:hypothetical protein NX059_008851 [Plenodomus lindquistii]